MRNAITVFFIVSLEGTPVIAAGFDDPAQRLSQGPEVPEGLSIFVLGLFLLCWLLVAI